MKNTIAWIITYSLWFGDWWLIGFISGNYIKTLVDFNNTLQSISFGFVFIIIMVIILKYTNIVEKIHNTVLQGIN